MIVLFVKKTWTPFYKKGMKTWEIRKYPINYRGDILLVESGSNNIICKMTLTDCIPLSKKRWEMNYEKHRTTCSYEELPYRNNSSPGYAWILNNPELVSNPPIITRIDSAPYFTINDSMLNASTYSPIAFKAERIACKFIGDTMLLYLLQKDYFALVAITDLSTQHTQIITSEISSDSEDSVIHQLVP